MDVELTASILGVLTGAVFGGLGVHYARRQLSLLAPERVAHRRRMARPRQLPPGPTPFVGRTSELTVLDRLVASRRRTASGAAALVCGQAGVGKSALVVYWAHRARRHFPDGELCVDLGGFDAGPTLTADEALTGLLRALQVPAERIPSDLAAKAALYRTALGGRRVLVVLDNARSAEQVRPLLPASRGCVAVVTSRSRLSGLTVRDGVHRLELGQLPDHDAVDLLRRVVGAQRVAAAPECAAALARICGNLPLALRIAGNRVAEHHVPLGEVLGELADERRRLGLLATTDGDSSTAVNAVFSWSYRALTPAATRLFRLLGLHYGAEISTAAAAALTATTEPAVRPTLDALVDVSMLEHLGADRYRFHDLVRVYAAQCVAEDETGEERDSAQARLLTWYLHSADAACRTLARHRRRVELGPVPVGVTPAAFSTHGQALAWCEAERRNLVVAIDRAHERGQHDVAWQMAVALYDFFNLRKARADWIRTHTTGLAAARAIGDRFGEAWVLNSVGTAYRELGRHPESLACRQQALETFVALGDRWGAAFALSNLGATYADLDRLDEALDHLQRGLAAYRGIDNRWGEAFTLNHIARTLRRLRRFDESLRHSHAALTLHRTVGNRRGEGATLQEIATTYRDLQHWPQAVDAYQRALFIHREVGNRWGEGLTLASLAEAVHRQGATRVAIRLCRQAIVVLDEHDDDACERARTRLRHYLDARQSWLRRWPVARYRSSGAPLDRLADTAASSGS